MNPLDTETANITRDHCGCSRPARRICDVCQTQSYVFSACSNRCLQQHLHGHNVELDAMQRFRERQRQMNRHPEDTWTRYASHREHLMELLPKPAGGSLCVFGAGSCSDIDLERLAASFSSIHLVDIDGEALERARERQAPRVSERLVLCGDVDLSGFLHQLDSWGEEFPCPDKLGPAALTAARGIVQRLGQRFDVCLSTCVLSQLANPFQRAWAMPPTHWVSLDAALTGVHLTTIAGATRPGGTALIAFDVLTSDKEPELTQLAARGQSETSAFAGRALADGKLWPNPQTLLDHLSSPGLAGALATPQLTPPWLWDIRDAVQLVFGLTFERV